MGIFDFGRKDNVIDLSERYKRRHSEENDAGSADNFSSGSIDERRKKLAKRIADMTAQIENLSKQISNLNERIQVLEMKSKSDKIE